MRYHFGELGSGNYKRLITDFTSEDVALITRFVKTQIETSLMADPESPSFWDVMYMNVFPEVFAHPQASFVTKNDIHEWMQAWHYPYQEVNFAVHAMEGHYSFDQDDVDELFLSGPKIRKNPAAMVFVLAMYMDSRSKSGLPYILKNEGISIGRADPLSSGLDIATGEQIVVEPSKFKVVDLGIAVQLPRDCTGKLEIRSSYSQKLFLNAGRIDAGYIGYLKAVLFNPSSTDAVVVPVGAACVQLIIHKDERLKPVRMLVLQGTDRGDGGFGSTGKQGGAKHSLQKTPDTKEGVPKKMRQDNDWNRPATEQR